MEGPGVSRKARLGQLERDLAVDEGERPMTWQPGPRPDVAERLATAARDYLERHAQILEEAEAANHTCAPMRRTPRRRACLTNAAQPPPASTWPA